MDNPGRASWLIAALALTACAGAPAPVPERAASVREGVALTTLALRVHNTDAMVAFYSEAFGAEFREVDTFGIRSWFGEVGGVTIKLVPVRESADFVDYPSHQPGFEVGDVEAVIAIAERHGGRREGEILREGGRVHGSLRDPDGNTIELYADATD